MDFDFYYGFFFKRININALFLYKGLSRLYAMTRENIKKNTQSSAPIYVIK